MSANISDTLLRELAEAKRAEPQGEIPVIVTVTPGADVAALERIGLKIQHRYENIPAVSGTLTAPQVKALAQLHQVERIELDETAWALSQAGR